MALDGWRRVVADLAARIGLARLLPGSGVAGGALFYNCGRQGARSWWERTGLAVDFVEKAIAGLPTPVRLLDLGCGDEKVAAELARRDVAVDYLGFDLHPQSPRVRPLDLGRETISETGDVAVVLGVFEYLDDPTTVLGRIAAAAPRLVVSLAASDLGRSADFDPVALNWKLYVDRPTFEAHLAAAGWSIEARAVTPDGKTALWRCRLAG